MYNKIKSNSQIILFQLLRKYWKYRKLNFMKFNKNKYIKIIHILINNIFLINLLYKINLIKFYNKLILKILIFQ